MATPVTLIATQLYPNEAQYHTNEGVVRLDFWFIVNVLRGLDGGGGGGPEFGIQ